MSEYRFGLIAGRYVLRDQLGLGGMGRVWLAHDEMLGRNVAIKEVAPRAALTPQESDDLCRLILREARATARISHPHVVRIYDVIRTEQWPWIVMEYVPSESLQKLVSREGPLPPDEVAVIGLALLDALCAAHEAGVLHRDLKPENVLIGDDGRVVLTDFGLASVETDTAEAAVPKRRDGTHTGRLGTPQYVAPERARDGVSSREADLWSLGATLYAAVEGRSPYKRDSMLQTLTALANEPPDPMRNAGPLAPAIAGLLRRDPTARLKPPQLEPLLRAAATKPPPRRLSKRTTVVTVLITLLAGGFLAGETPTRTEALPPPAEGVMACELPAPDTRPVPGGQPAPPGQYPLMAGWTWYLGKGFSIAVPQHWHHWSLGGTVCFRDPSGSRVLGVGPGPLDAPGYALVGETGVLLAGPAREREFTYDGDERKRRAIALIAGPRIVLWACDDFDFQPSRSLYHVIKASFQA